jgi:hypothetical protein
LFIPDPVPTTGGVLILRALWQVFIVGCVGGAGGDLLTLAESLKKTAPGYVSVKRTVLGSLILAGLGGFVALLYGSPMNGILAFHLGASAPLIVKSASSAVPRLSSPRID